MAKPIFEDNDPGFKKLIKRTKGPDNVDVGVFANQGSDLVIYAASNEFGTNEIPERSFLRAGIDEGRRRLQEFAKSQAVRVLLGKIKKKNALKLLGLKAEEGVIRKIDKGPFKPNAPATIKKKGSSKPLIDTGRLRQAITSRVGRR
jgi:hypothetical protein